MDLGQIQKVYFLGIGGIGMSALARYFKGRGVHVSGYDRTETILTRKLVAEGIDIHYKDEPVRVPKDADLVVYTPAIPADLGELKTVRASGLTLHKRAEVLGFISREMRTIAVAGTHGKTSTSSMLAWLLRAAGIDVTAFLGGIAANFQSNFVQGMADWMVVEADEYDRSFLHLHPDRAVILSMDPDHLDIYGDADAVKESGFLAFARQLKPGGRLFVQRDWASQLEEAGAQADLTFGLEGGDYHAHRIRVAEGSFVFDLHTPAGNLPDWQLPMPGRHNVSNATAALAVCLELGLSPSSLQKGLARFRGVKRRFEWLYRHGEVAYVDDYAHHPVELKAAIGAAREFFPGKKITGLFQPHLYSRTSDFAEGFGQALDMLDACILLDVYPAREQPITGVDSGLIAGHMKKKPKAIVPLEGALKALEETGEMEVVITLGAGNIDTLTDPIVKMLVGRYGANEI